MQLLRGIRTQHTQHRDLVRAGQWVQLHPLTHFEKSLIAPIDFDEKPNSIHLF